MTARRSWRVSDRQTNGAPTSRWRSVDTALAADPAVEVLRPLHDELESEGRTPLLRRVRRTLRAAGERVPIISGTPVAPLSGAQVIVLEHVARGLSAEAIADRLLVGTETVQTHTRVAMRRLGVPTRVAAALALARLRGIGPRPPGQEFVLDGDPEDGADLAVAPIVIPGEPWSLADRRFRLRVVDRDDADRAVLCAVRGASLDLMLAPGLPRELEVGLRESLGRLGHVRSRPEACEAPPVDTRWIRALDVLAGGGTASTAAAAAGVSVRTLYRSLSELRRRFGVTSNTELVSRVALGENRRRREPG